MIDRRRVMTPSAHNGNIKHAQLRGVVTNDPRGAAHLPPVSRRERRYFYLFATTPSRGDSILLNSSRSCSMGCLYAKLRELFHSLNPLGTASNAVAFPQETLRCQLREMALMPAAKRESPSPDDCTISCVTLLLWTPPSELGTLLLALLSCAIVLTGPIGTR